MKAFPTEVTVGRLEYFGFISCWEYYPRALPLQVLTCHYEDSILN